MKLRSKLAFLALVAIASIAIGVSWTEAAPTHRPGFVAEPFFTGELKVGSTLTGDYNTKICDPECHVIDYQWIACDQPGGGGFDGPPGGLPDTSRPCPGAGPQNIIQARSASRTFVVPVSLGGRRVQLEVFLGANDCDGERPPNCRYSESHAYSPASAIIPVLHIDPPNPPQPPTVCSPASVPVGCVADVVRIVRTGRDDVIRLRAEGADWPAIKLQASWRMCRMAGGCR